MRKYNFTSFKYLNQNGKNSKLPSDEVYAVDQGFGSVFCLDPDPDLNPVFKVCKKYSKSYLLVKQIKIMMT